jgi:hypothetical protein
MPLPSIRTLTPEEIAGGPSTNLAESLERGAIVQFPPDAFPLPTSDDLGFLRNRLGQLLKLKNISYHPGGDYLSGIKHDPQARGKTRQILRDHNREVTRILRGLLPEYASDWYCGKVNFRPLEEKGRQISRHSSNELLHVDAFASGATHGDRTLRFFTNIHPTESRKWKSAGLFEDMLAEFGGAAGAPPKGNPGLKEGPLDRAFTGLVRGIAKLGLPQIATIDSSPYDRAMHRLHNTLKDDEAFQRDEARCGYFEFPPFSSWMVFTDLVSHACVSGQHAIVNTWTVRRPRLRLPELSPYAVMARSR